MSPMAGCGDRLFARSTLAGFLALAVLPTRSMGAEKPALAHFQKKIQPILTEYCSDCHADGAKKGNVDFDELKSDDGSLGNNDLWLKVLKNVRAGLMPPEKKPRPSLEERKQLECLDQIRDVRD